MMNYDVKFGLLGKMERPFQLQTYFSLNAALEIVLE